MKAHEVIKRAKDMIKAGYVYVYGYKGTKVTREGVNVLAKQYPSVYTDSIKSMAMRKIGKMGIDCSGFVCKAAGITPIGSTQIKDSASKLYPVHDTSHIKNGMFIWKQGHIGLIEVDSKGNKYILEAKGTAYDLTKSKWSDRASHFMYYGEIKGVDYSSTKESKSKKDEPSKKYYPKYTGKSTSIANALDSMGIDGSKAHRKKIATANGIKGYIGSASQNTKMLSLLKKGKLVKA